jgi:hypothetical protein
MGTEEEGQMENERKKIINDRERECVSEKGEKSRIFHFFTKHFFPHFFLFSHLQVVSKMRFLWYKT